jgi:hypothetical protein
MFDFTNLDSKVVAQFWIYFLGIGIIGFIAGWFVRVILTKTTSDNFRSEKEKFEADKASLFVIKEKYEALLKDLKKNDEYWLYKKQTSGSPAVDPSELLHNGLKKK